MLSRIMSLFAVGACAASALEFAQFKDEFYKVDLTKIRMAPDGHEIHVIQDANDVLFTWDKTEGRYVHHDVDKHHHKETGHHHNTIFDFDPESPPEKLQYDDDGHPLVEIVNQKHEIRTGEYVAPKLAYHPYHGPYVTKLLIDAVNAGDYKGVMHLLQTTRVDPNAQDELGNTALHYAHELANVQIVCLLGTFHADFSVKNKKGLTPFDLFEEAYQESRGPPYLAALRETLGDDIIRANFRFSPHAGHEHWEPGAKFTDANPENWNPSNGKYHHHLPGQPVGLGEPDQLDL
eukprot:g4994.t1